ncbi:MAG: hypothetical protein PGN26_07455 [Xylophilus ampelinus]
MPTPTVPGFGQFIPGFDFLRQLTQTAGQAQQPAGAIPGMPAVPSWADWVAPTLQPEELQKRIGELKTVQFWLEQNNRAVAATVQALEVQKMTLAALKNMGVPFEQWTEAFRAIAGQATDAASQFWRQGAEGAAVAMPANPFAAIFGGAAGAPAAGAPAAPPAPRPADPQAHAAVPDFFSPFTSALSGGAGDKGAAAEAPAAPPAAPAAGPAPSAAAGVDPMAWWSALTGQFQEIARSAMQDLADRTATQVQSLTEAAGAATDAAVAAVATAVPQVVASPSAPRRPSRSGSRSRPSSAAPAKRPAAKAAAPAPAARTSSSGSGSKKAPARSAAPAPSPRRTTGR